MGLSGGVVNGTSWETGKLFSSMTVPFSIPTPMSERYYHGIFIEVHVCQKYILAWTDNSWGPAKMLNN